MTGDATRDGKRLTQESREASHKGCSQARLRRRTGAHLGMAWLASVRLGFTFWRTVPRLFSSCRAFSGALDRDAQKPLCYASGAISVTSV